LCPYSSRKNCEIRELQLRHPQDLAAVRRPKDTTNRPSPIALPESTFHSPKVRQSTRLCRRVDRPHRHCGDQIIQIVAARRKPRTTSLEPASDLPRLATR